MSETTPKRRPVPTMVVSPSTVHQTHTPSPSQSSAVPPTARPTAPPVHLPGYEVIRELGRGGMGVVYLAKQLGLNRLVALKMVLSSGHASQEDVTRFRLEAEAVARLRHPHIVQIFDVGQHQRLPYFSLEYCAGGTLAQHLDGAPLPPPLAARLIGPIAEAVHAAHTQQIIHRDLKPANILLQIRADTNSTTLTPNQPAESGAYRALHAAGASGAHRALGPGSSQRTPAVRTSGRHRAMGASSGSTGSSANDERFAMLEYKFIPKLTDFGLAKEANTDHGNTQTGAILGTPSYMAPEQADSAQNRTIGPAADIYALGAILYELITGRPPFKAHSPLATIFQVLTTDPVPPTQLQSSTPRDLENIVLKCLHKEPAKRYASAQELADDLSRFLADEPVKARPIGRIERAVRWARRRPALASLWASLVTLTVVGLTLIVWQWREAVTALALADERLQAATAARAEEETQRQHAEEQEADARTQRTVAEAARRHAQQALDTLTDEVVERLLAQQQKLDVSEQQFLNSVLTFYQDFAANGERTVEARLAAAAAYFRLGRLRYRLGLGLPEAEQAWKAALKLRQELASENPKNVSYRRAVADQLNHLAGLYTDLGRLSEAEKLLRQARSLYLRLLEQNQNNTIDQQGLADNHNRLGYVLSKQDKQATALDELKSALAIVRRLASDEPNDWGKQREVAKLLNNLGNHLRTMNQEQEAEQAFRQAVSLSIKLLERHGARIDLMVDLAGEYSNLGNLLMDAGRATEAEPVFKKGLEILDGVIRELPGVPQFRKTVAGTQMNLALSYLRFGRATEAEPLLRLAVGAFRQLAADTPTQPDSRYDLAVALKGHARALGQLGRGDDADDVWREALATLAELTQRFTTISLYRQQHAETQTAFAQSLFERKRTPEAERHFRTALSTFEALAKQAPNEPLFLTKQLEIRHFLLAVLEGAQRTAEAEELLAASLQFGRRLVRELPARADIKNMAAYFVNRTARARIVAKDYAAAEELLLEASCWHEQILAEAMRHSTGRLFYREHLLIRADLYLAQQKLPAATAMVDELLRSNLNPAHDLADGAVVLARCAELAPTDAKPAYLNRAKNLAQQATKKGYNGANRPEFRALLP